MPRLHSPGFLSLAQINSIWACCFRKNISTFFLDSTSLFPGHCLNPLLGTGTRGIGVHDLLSHGLRWAGEGGGPRIVCLYPHLRAFTHFTVVHSSAPGRSLGSGVHPASVESFRAHTGLADGKVLLRFPSLPNKSFQNAVSSNNHFIAPSAVGRELCKAWWRQPASAPCG